MKKFIRKRVANLYLTPEGLWTHDLNQAWPVESATEAIARARALQLEEVDLYYSFAKESRGNQWDFSVPLRDGPKHWTAAEGAEHPRGELGL